MDNFNPKCIDAFPKIFPLAFLLVAASLCANGQLLKNQIPATPTTAALGKYGEVPVSMHTGVPNISVPLAQLSGKDLSLPVSLSYHAGGVKVEEISSWVGLGWSLFAGGVITREVRGLPDEETNGFFSNIHSNEDFSQNHATNVENALSNLADFEPDMFYFNFAGESGKFIFNRENGLFTSTSRDKKKITYHTTQSSLPTGKKFFSID